MAYVPFRFFSMIDVSILMATELFPPWGTMISAYRFVGSMNCRCMGFTVFLGTVPAPCSLSALIPLCRGDITLESLSSASRCYKYLDVHQVP